MSRHPAAPGGGPGVALLPLLALLILGALVAPACSDDGTPDGRATGDPAAADRGAADRATGDITVSAAASLQEAFTRIGHDFEVANPGATVRINVGSSGGLATQILGGAPADVAAFAAESNMTTLTDAGRIAGSPTTFATNRLVIVTKPTNPKRVTGLADLAEVAASGGTVSLCIDTAPCGAYADRILTAAGVTIPDDKVTRGQDVRATLAAVADGDADVGIVYVTDATAAGDSVARVEIPPDRNVVARYPIAVVQSGDGSADGTASAGGTAAGGTARAFVDYVLGDRAQAVLRDAGFGAP